MSEKLMQGVVLSRDWHHDIEHLTDTISLHMCQLIYEFAKFSPYSNSGIVKRQTIIDCDETDLMDSVNTKNGAVKMKEVPKTI